MKTPWQCCRALAFLGFGVLLAAQTASAAVRMPCLFSSHMVLQRERPVVVWGWAEPSEKVTVTLRTKQQEKENREETKANERGEWKVVLPALQAGGPYTLTVSGTNTIVLEDVMVGEVWLCSGQSNMEIGVPWCVNGEQETAAANHPDIRLFVLFHGAAASPQPAPNAPGWKVCSPATIVVDAGVGAGGFSGTAYFFAREIQKKLGVPVGLIQTAWGGTRIEPWISQDALAAVPALKSLYDQAQMLNPRSEPYKQRLNQYLKVTEDWMAKARKALNEGTDVPAMPAYPKELLPVDSLDPGRPTVLYNSMVHTLAPFPIRGAIWYQGESNAGDGAVYTEKMKALINGWRRLWNQGDFPFYYVQIAPAGYGNPPMALPEFWEAQAAVQNVVPNTAMALTLDIGQPTRSDGHPTNKQDVGRRLALLALAKTYGQKNLVCSGPTYKSMSTDDDKLRVTFDNVGGGLVSRGGKPLEWFEIAETATGKFVKAQARIDGPTVVLSAEGVKQPTAVRFAWGEGQAVGSNLMNREGLPAGPFRAGQMPK
jgi:sialate O-acetylesterase